MKLTIRSPILAAMALGLACAAQALPITPDTGVLNVTRWQGPETGQSAIDAVIGPIVFPSTEVYKDNVGGIEEGPLAGSYETTYLDLPDPTSALIEYTGGPIVQPTAYLLVKDGNADPGWYLFDLTALGWLGVETLELSGFWPGKGSISHVALYGGEGGTRVPDGGMTMALLGLGLLCVEGLRRKLALI
jgi:hypothetical protein